MTVRVTVLYFASLRDAVGTGAESVETAAADLRGLYEELQARHQWSFAIQQLRVARDGAFVPWSDPLPDGCEVAFIPPVSGG